MMSMVVMVRLLLRIMWHSNTFYSIAIVPYGRGSKVLLSSLEERVADRKAYS
jgi:hypothetical protein